MILTYNSTVGGRDQRRFYSFMAGRAMRGILPIWSPIYWQKNLVYLLSTARRMGQVVKEKHLPLNLLT